MDNYQKHGPSSSSSFAADLFGTKESLLSSSSSAGIFASIFPPPSTVLGRKSSGTEVTRSWQKQLSGNQGWNVKQAPNGDTASYNMPNKDRKSIFQEEVEPCHLSSSLYYGGQDNYSQSTQTAGSHSMFKKQGGEDDLTENSSHGASRGNWWEGSLYY